MLLVLPALMLASCSLFGDDDGLTELEQQRQRWERLGINAYEYDLNRLCFFGHVGVVRVQVRADTVFAAADLETGLPVVDQPYRVMTVDGLFDVVKEAFERADHLDVRYDETFGYPAHVDIDYIENAVDDEVVYVAENLRPLRAP